MALQPVSLDDKYDLTQSRIFVTGFQALVRLTMMQKERDRRAGLNTAGYVSGYIRTVHSKEEITLRGADASHAWVAVWCGAATGWVHLDPTNDLVAKEDHVVVAWGSDFSDVSPLRGVILGGGSHSYGVAVTLIPTT